MKNIIVPLLLLMLSSPAMTAGSSAPFGVDGQSSRFVANI